MLKKLILAAAAFIALASPAFAQNPQTVKLCVPTSTTACPVVTASAPLPVTGTFSATLAGFTPNGSYTTLTATAASSASTNLPTGTVVAFQNLSTVDVSCVLTAGASTATTNKLIVRGGATVYYTVGSNTTTACINQTGSASNVVGLAGGSGLGTAFGGGGGGGGTVVQGNAGSNAQAWWTQIGDTARGPAKVQAGNAAAVADVALTVTDPNVLAAVNSGVGTPGSAVPSTGIYVGGNVAGNFRGWTGVSPSGSVYSQQMDLASVNGVTASTGTGAVGTGTPRVAVGTDTATVAGSTPAVAGFAATGAAPPSGSQQMGAVGSGATGGLMAGLKTCDLHAKYDASDNGSIEMIAAVSGRTIYVCGFLLATGGTATNLKLVDGTGTNCATGTPVDLTPAYQLVANDKIGANSAFWNGLKTTGTNRALCVNASAGNAHQAEVWYTIQ